MQTPPGLSVAAPLSDSEEALRQQILRDVDERIQASVLSIMQNKLGDLLAEGRKMVQKERQTREEEVKEVQQLASEIQKSTEGLELEVRRCKEENDSLKQAMKALSQRLAGSLVLPPVPDFPVPPSSTSSLTASWPASPVPPGLCGDVAASPVATAAASAKLSLEKALNLDSVVSCTLRKADGVDLGVDLIADDQGLRVQNVTKEGTVEAWNRQCVGRAQVRAIRPGDLIISVNGIEGDNQRMRMECQSKQTLRLMFIHDEFGAGGAEAAAARARRGRSLNASAEAFVPSSPMPAAGVKDEKPKEKPKEHMVAV